MDHGPWSTAHAYQDLDDRRRQARRGADAETEDGDGQSEFHGPWSVGDGARGMYHGIFVR